MYRMRFSLQIQGNLVANIKTFHIGIQHQRQILLYNVSQLYIIWLCLLCFSLTPKKKEGLKSNVIPVCSGQYVCALVCCSRQKCFCIASTKQEFHLVNWGLAKVLVQPDMICFSLATVFL